MQARPDVSFSAKASVLKRSVRPMNPAHTHLRARLLKSSPCLRNDAFRFQLEKLLDPVSDNLLTSNADQFTGGGIGIDIDAVVIGNQHRIEGLFKQCLKEAGVAPETS